MGASRVARHARLHRWLPITAWAGAYQRRWLRPDAIAALTVIGLLVPERWRTRRSPASLLRPACTRR